MSDYWKDNNIEKPQQVVVCAACRRGETILAGARHFDKVMSSQIIAIDGGLFPGGGVGFEEGFIDQFGDFLTREEAMKIAIAAGQKVDIKRGCGGDKEILYSEGLY
jgi:hypothetical protein